MNYILHYDIAASLLAVVLMIHFLNRKKIMTPQTTVFLWLLWFNLFSCLLDMGTVLIELINPPVAVGYISNALYLLVFNTVPAIYLSYILITVGKRNSFNLLDKFIVFVPISICYLFIITTPITKWVFSYDEISRYQHGNLMYFLYVVAMYYVVMCLIISIKYRHMMTIGQRTSVYFYNTSSVITIIMQRIYPNVLMMQFTVTLCLLLAYLALEIPKDDEDYTLGIFSRSGFIKRIRTSINTKKEFRLLGINLVSYQLLRETMGVEQSQNLVKQLIETLLPKIRPMRMFVVAPGQYMLYTDDNSLDLNEIVKNVRDEFHKPIHFMENDIELEIYLYQLDYPKNAQTVEDILDIIDFSMEMVSGKSDKDIVHTSEEIFLKKRRENHIDQLLQSAIKEKRFEVYYQPIYSVKEKRYQSAEALLRLQDESGEFISPEEFIPLAEKTGRIIEIGEFVFRNVCRMLKQEKLWDRGINYIEINLSVVQCMQGNLHQRLKEIMDEYEISPRYINLEMTETATVVSRDMLWQNMDRLIEHGVTFSLDDYGTGYSNIANVIRYPFFIIKIDKSVIWYAMENERAMRALRHTIAMLKDLDMYIVAEGVETEEQVNQLEAMGCDYFQGYYYSKPVPLSVFLQYLAS